MRKINFAICDDEPFMVQEIADAISRYMKERRLISYSIRCFSSGRLLMESSDDFDVIFLDIQMEHPNGMETAKALRRQKNHGLLIFVTVLKEAVFDAFEVEAYDYLVKPLEETRFRRTMDRAVRTLGERGETRMIIRRGNSCEIVLLDQIVYCEVQGRKIYLHQQDGKVIDYYEKLDAVERQVDGRFFRCHRSYLVNLNYVRGCASGQVILPQGEKIPVSRLRERELMQALLRCMKGRDF